jgi:hypothetical protein
MVPLLVASMANVVLRTCARCFLSGRSLEGYFVNTFSDLPKIGDVGEVSLLARHEKGG